MKNRLIQEENDNLRVLVVEYNKETSDKISSALESQGYDVHQTDNVYNGIKLVQNNNYAMVLADMRMPGSDGSEVLKCIKDPSTHAIALVPGNSLDEVTKAIGCSEDFIQMPIESDDLVNTVNSKLRYKEHQEINEYGSRLSGLAGDLLSRMKVGYQRQDNRYEVALA